MRICLLYSKEAFPYPKRRGFLCGLLSYVASEDRLFIIKDIPLKQADILVVSAKNMSKALCAPLCREAKRMKSSCIFLDTESTPDKELFSELLQNKLEVFAPFSKGLSHGITPVIETVVSGGSLSEYLGSAGATFPRFAVSVRRAAYEIVLPADRQNTNELTQRELRSLISLHEPDIFFSPQLMCKYFLINTEKEAVSLVLFDDAETISGKLRLAKKHGASHAFLVYNEIADIFDNIVF